MNYQQKYIENLNDNMLSLKLSEESEHLSNLLDDLEWMEFNTPNKKVSIKDIKTMIEEQKKLVSTIENELNNRKAA